MFAAEILEDAQETALDALAGVVDIANIEVASVVEGQHHRVGNRLIRCLAVQPVEQAVKRNDMPARIVKRLEIRLQRNVVVVRRAITTDVLGVVGEDGDHADP